MDTEYLKNAAIYVITALISILVIAYIVIQLTGSFGNAVTTTPAVYVTERSLVSLNAYVIRKEKVLYSQYSGSVNYYYANGSKVGVDAPVAAVYMGTENISDEIIRIDNKISLLEDSNIGDDMVISDTATLDSRITQSYTSIADHLANGDIEYAILNRNDLLTMLNRRQIMVKSITDFNDRIETLQTERETLMASLGGNLTEIITDISGYFYNEVDGYESAFSAVDIDTLTIAGFTELTQAEPVGLTSASANGYAIGKIAEGYAWYIACEIPYSELYNYTINKNYTLIYPYSGDEEITANLYRTITEPNSDRAVLVFKNGIIRSGFNFLRQQTVEIVGSSYSGYKIPISAVRIVDGEKGVYVLNGSVVEFKKIEPLFEKNGYLVVEERDPSDETQLKRLNAYEAVIISNGDYYDGQIIS